MTPLTLALLVATEAAPPPPPPADTGAAPRTSAVVVNEPAPQDLPWRVRAGVLAGVAQQNTHAQLGIAYDFARVHKLVRLLVDMTFGFRPGEVSLIPTAGARFILPLQVQKLEAWVGGLVGLNITFVRAGANVAVPFRIATGAVWKVTDRLGLGLELSAEVGPLIVPVTATYAAAHAAAVMAWSM